MIRTITLTLFAGFFILTSQAQDSDWQPTAEDFVAAYDSFPGAEAVILGEWGDLVAERDGIRLKYTVRIHVLNESGREYAEYETSFNRRNGAFKLKNAISYNLTESGEVEISELSKDDIFKERVTGDAMSIKFTIPDVRVGSIITYNYERKTGSPYSFVWRYQSSIPAIQSTVLFTSDPELNYTNVALGALAHKMESLGGQNFRMSWLPAKKDEPYIPNEGNYEPRIRFQLSYYYDPAQLKNVEVIRTWNSFGKTFLELEFVSHPGRRARTIREMARNICRDTSDPEQQARAIYRFLQENMEWDREYDLIPTKEPIDVLEEKSGTSADINNLMFHMMSEMGIDCSHAAIGTRNHSIMIPAFTILSQFNTMLVYCTFGDKQYALDATDPLRPFELAPISTLNRIILVVAENNTRWEEMPINKVSTQMVSGFLKVDSSGYLTGKSKLSHTGYLALIGKKLIEEEGMEAFWEWRMDEGFDPDNIASHKVLGLTDPDSALTVTLAFDYPNFAMTAGEYMYIQPIIVDKILENPFKDSVRIYPIDFSYPVKSIYRVSYVVPEGYAFEEGPTNSQVVLPQKELSFTYMAEDAGFSYNVMNEFAMQKTFYQAEDNGMLRTIYDEIISRHGQQIVLKKTEQPSEDE